MSDRVQIDFADAFTAVSHTNSLPLYSQVIHQIEDAMRRGIVRTGDYLPAEPALCSGFGVARTTLRRAIGQLQNRGIVSVMQGVGTKVIRQPQVDFSAATSVSLYADLRAAQSNPSTVVLGVEPSVVDLKMSQRTMFPVGAKVVCLQRLRLAGETPIAFMTNFLLAHLVDFDVARLADSSLDELLRGKGHLTKTIEYEVTAAVASSHAAEALGIVVGSPLLRECRWAYTARDEYINYSENFYHPTSYHFRGVLIEDVPEMESKDGR